MNAEALKREIPGGWEAGLQEQSVERYAGIVVVGLLTITSGVSLNVFHPDPQCRNMGVQGDPPDVLILIDLDSARQIPDWLAYLDLEAWRGMCLALLSSAAMDLGSRYPPEQRGETYRSFRAVISYFLRYVKGCRKIPTIDEVAEQNDVPTPGIGCEAGVPLVAVATEQLAAACAMVDDIAGAVRTCEERPGEVLHPTRGGLKCGVHERQESAAKASVEDDPTVKAVVMPPSSTDPGWQPR